MSPLHSRTPALPFPTAVPVQNHASGRRGEVEREQARGSGSTRRSADSVYTSHNMCTNTLRVPHGSLLLRANFRDFPRTIPFRKQHAKSSLAAVVYFFSYFFFFPPRVGRRPWRLRPVPRPWRVAHCARCWVASSFSCISVSFLSEPGLE